jgi:hypothetical protein
MYFPLLRPPEEPLWLTFYCSTKLINDRKNLIPSAFMHAMIRGNDSNDVGCGSGTLTKRQLVREYAVVE